MLKRYLVALKHILPPCKLLLSYNEDMFNLALLDNSLILKHLFTMLSWERLMIGVRSFYKNDHSWTDYRLVLSDLKFVNLEFFVTVDNNVSCYVTLGDLKRWSHGEKRSVTHQCSISSEKTKVTQFSRFCRFMTYTYLSDLIWIS